MYFINPFKGLRPTERRMPHQLLFLAPIICQKKSVVDHKNSNSWSYLNVFGAENKSKSKEQFELMKKNSILIKENKQFILYL